MSFEMKEGKVMDSQFRLMFVQCALCGAVVGAMDFYNIGQLIHDLASKLNVRLDH